ncbi:MAG: DUF3563 family protein [Betaproteobacteria bacterium]|nr:DUF3563 family protein [Betaproteobacteria bacterium]MBI2959582.1 DUF3563 family protein [Betaproteobacteria bacterium]
MSYTGTIYEGDSLIHRMPLRSETPDVEEAGLEFGAVLRRIATAWRTFFDWLERTSSEARYRQVEAYLSQASDLADLERRQRNLERNHQHFFI